MNKGLKGNILITGGAGYLGRAIIQRALSEKWDCEITVFSTDPTKHAKLPLQVNTIVGDIRDEDTLMLACIGKDVIVHGAAQKEIPTSEYNSIDCFGVNVEGSLVVAKCALMQEVPHVLAISTDKACKPANAYGASKMMMEKMWQEFSRVPSTTSFHLVRYGNVIESTASVLTKWKADHNAGKPIKMTDPNMTRFWISPDMAVDYVLSALELESGNIYVPKMKSTSLLKLAEYTVGAVDETEIERIPIRPGEKIHEELLTIEETFHAVDMDDHFVLEPSTATLREPCREYSYNSFNAPRFTRDEFMEMING